MEIALPSFGKRLKRLRRMKGLKQEVIASIAQVNQATVSRWESGTIVPDENTIRLILAALNRLPVLDSALRRLIHASSLPVHLITDVDHRLLAASIPRQQIWGISESNLLHSSLWRYATQEIVRAETQLANSGWWEVEAPEVVYVNLQTPHNLGLQIQAGTMVWERIWLANGTPARLCTSLMDHA